MLAGALLILIVFFRFGDKNEFTSSEPAILQTNGSYVLPEGSPLRARIDVGAVSTSEVRRRVLAPATVEANPSKRANIFPPAGGRIVQMMVSLGQTVGKDQPLFELYSPEIAEIQSQYVSARSALSQAGRALSRAEDLHEKGIISRRELEETQTEYEIARSELDGIALTLRIFGMTEEDLGKPLLVRSPINGRVVDMQVSAGEYIADADEPLLIIADLSSVWITASIQEKDIRFIHPGAEVEARFPAYPGEVYSGEVLFINDILDQETRTTRVRIEFDNPSRKLKPGMFASASFLTPPENHILVPSTAVRQRRDFNYVYIENASYSFEMRRVRTAEVFDDQIIVLEGLQEGDRIVTRNAILLP